MIHAYLVAYHPASDPAGEYDLACDLATPGWKEFTTTKGTVGAIHEETKRKAYGKKAQQILADDGQKQPRQAKQGTARKAKAPSRKQQIEKSHDYFTVATDDDVTETLQGLSQADDATVAEAAARLGVRPSKDRKKTEAAIAGKIAAIRGKKPKTAPKPKTARGSEVAKKVRARAEPRPPKPKENPPARAVSHDELRDISAKLSHLERKTPSGGMVPRVREAANAIIKHARKGGKVDLHRLENLDVDSKDYLEEVLRQGDAIRAGRDVDADRPPPIQTQKERQAAQKRADRVHEAAKSGEIMDGATEMQKAMAHKVLGERYMDHLDVVPPDQRADYHNAWHHLQYYRHMHPEVLDTKRLANVGGRDFIAEVIRQGRAAARKHGDITEQSGPPGEPQKRPAPARRQRRGR